MDKQYLNYIDSMRATYDPLYDHDYTDFNTEYDLLVFGTTEEQHHEDHISTEPSI